MSTALVNIPTPQIEALSSGGYSLKEIIRLGQIFADSGFFQDSKGEAQCITKILAGQEMGIAPFAALTGIHIIGGKPSVGAGLMAQKLKESGKYDYRVLQHDNEVCEIEFFELVHAGGFTLKKEKESLGIERFTIQDAREAELMKNPMWKKYPRNMLFARTMSNGVGFKCPDVFTTRVYTPEELGAQTDEQGNVIEEVQHAANTPAHIHVDQSTDVFEGEVEPVPIVFKTKRHDGKRPDELNDADLRKYLDHWNAGNQVRPELREEVERVLNERAENGDLEPLPAKPQNLAGAIAAKVEQAKRGNPEEEKDFDHDAQGVDTAPRVEAGPELLTERQEQAIQATAAKLYGPKQRDEKLSELIAGRYGEGKELANLLKGEASDLYGYLNEKLQAQQAEATPPKESNKYAHIYAAAAKAGVTGKDKAARIAGVNAFFAALGGIQKQIDSFSDLLPGSDVPLIGALEDGKFGANWEFPNVVEGEVTE